MVSPAANATPVVRRLTKRLGDAGFTLLEIVIALGVLGTMSSGAYIGFNAINAYAVSTRLYSEAQAVAQNQIDLILSKGPFNITSIPNKVPTILELGTKIQPNVFVYTDPVTGQNIVTGTMTTTISDPNLSQAYMNATTPLSMRKATVVVSYQFRNRNYAVTMHTLRTADQ
jgi:prepilin-type N-terminal cleavage/methylation domain-containing protein